MTDDQTQQAQDSQTPATSSDSGSLPSPSPSPIKVLSKNSVQVEECITCLNMKNYFAFIDESGNLTSERYFGLGMLLVKNTGPLYDAIKPFHDRVRDLSKIQKEKTVSDLMLNQKYEDIAKIAKSNRRFELKFKYINFTNNSVYKDLVKNYFKFPDCRFSAIIIDREDPQFKPQDIFASPWFMYLSYSALLLANNINNLDHCNVCVLADELSRPKNFKKSFEEALEEKITLKLKKDGISRAIFNITRLESHSSLLLQLVDILLGCVLYDFKKQVNLISEKLEQRQDPVVSEMREILKRDSLASHFTVDKPSYFNVWKMQWKNKNAGHGQKTHTR